MTTEMTLSDLTHRTADVVEKSGREPVVITRWGKPTRVIVDYDAWRADGSPGEPKEFVSMWDVLSGIAIASGVDKMDIPDDVFERDRSELSMPRIPDFAE